MIRLTLTHPMSGPAGPVNLDLSLHLPPGSITGLFGPSGAGKSTLLKIIAGLIRPKNCRLKIEGQLCQDRKIFIPPQKRRVGLLFQNYALFPHKSVRANISYAATDPALVNELLDLMKLEKLAKAYPAELSGGQAQRVALARALAARPRILLLDEPFSALDQPLRRGLRVELGAILARFGLTTLIVSHEPADLAALASRVLCLDGGRIVRDEPAGVFAEDPGRIFDELLRELLLELSFFGTRPRLAASPAPPNAGQNKP